MDKIFCPKSIAVIGASKKRGGIGRSLMQNLIDGGFKGTLVPVNPKYKELFGLRVCKSMAKVKVPIDLAVIATPIHTVPDITAECVAAGVGGAVVISAGGKEAGEKGRDLEARIRKTAYEGGLRIVGPNCLGVICPQRQLNASFAAGMPNPGRLAFISQSGAICTAIMDLAFQENIGFSHFVSIGSMLDVDFGDMIDYLGNDPDAGSILLYIENLTNFRKFMSAARAVSRVKPIVVLKSGRSAAGARAAASHTGAMAGEDAVYDAAFKRAGVVRVDTIEDLFDCAELMAKQPRPRKPLLAIITNGGGPGVMATDALARYGLEPAPLTPETFRELDRVLPPFWSRNNPIDILGDASAERYAKAVDICLRSKAFNGVLVILTPQAMTRPDAVAEKLADMFRGKPFPVFTAWMGGRNLARSIEKLNQAGIPTYETPERAIRAFLYMVQYYRNLELLHEIPPKQTRRFDFDRPAAGALIKKSLEAEGGFLSETASKEILATYGIKVNPVQTAASGEAAVAAARRIGFPLVMKIVSPDITHKTEANGVQLDLRTAADVETAYAKIMEGARAYRPDARIAGVSLQPFIPRPDFEILLGAKKDDNFGPVILFGMGGIYTEVLRDRAIGLPPLNRMLARRLIEETRVHRLLVGYRNRPPANLEMLEEIIVRLAQLMVDFPEIVELDMNPVAIKDGLPHVVDARIRVRASEISSPMHLVISPYPAQYECLETTKVGMKIFIRPVRPEDANLLIDLFNTLSPTTIYYRFFRHIKALSNEMLARLTQIDYDREMALVAIDAQDSAGKILGVARIIADPDRKKAEFSILTGDPWQGKGVGARLLEHLLKVAQKQGVESIWGYVLCENTSMINLGKKAGFSVAFNPDEKVYELSIDLKPSVGKQGGQARSSGT